MREYVHKVAEAVEWLRERTRMPPRAGLLAGTGLGGSLAGMETHAAVEYRDIPHFPASTVRTHQGRLLLGEAHGRGVVAMQGRLHLYEGYSPLEVTFPLRVLAGLGIRSFLFASAVGGINAAWSAGDIALITDHINLTGENPLVGPNVDQWGPRFPDMSAAYDRELGDAVRTAAAETVATLRQGVYAGLKGPSLETPAELRWLRTIGADMVGLSSVLEVIAARHAGIRVLGLGIVTNMADPDNPVPASFDEIVAVADAASGTVSTLFGAVLAGMEG
ncbi:MAG: purine-nucleoside phosphorylase [Desulfatibacillaceae bacterium]